MRCAAGQQAFRALKCLIEKAFDAIVVEHSLPDSQGRETLEQLQPYADRSPIVMVTKDEQESDALENVQAGGPHCHCQAEADPDDLALTIRQALARHQQATANFDVERARESVAKTRAAAQPAQAGADRRLHPRYLLTRPLIAIPLLPDGQPLAAYQADGFTIDVSAEGVGFEIHGLERLPSHRLVIGIEADDGQLYFATLDVKRSEPIAGGLRWGAVCGSRPRPAPQRKPAAALNHRSHRFQTGLPTATLLQMGGAGYLPPALARPRCSSAPTARACRRSAAAAGPAAACGWRQPAHPSLSLCHVGLVEEFEVHGELVCPKCRQRRLIVGADFEYLSGPYRCLDCTGPIPSSTLVGQCLACELRFPIQQAGEEELIGYHVHRLDPLALVPQ